MAKRKKIDWEAIEKEYSLGQKSVRTIADQFDVAHTTITRRAKKDGWVQDKTKEIRDKTKAALVTHQSKRTTKRTTPTREDIDRAVQTNIEIIRGHRKDIRKGRQLVDLLSSQLMVAAEHREDLEDEIFKDTKGVEAGGEKSDLRRRNFMMKAVSLPSHAGVLRDLATTIKSLIPLERQAFSLDEAGATLEDVLAALPEQFRDGVREALAEAVS